jgi:hypothetical protein
VSDLAPFGHPVEAVAAVLADLVAVTYTGPQPLTAIQGGALPAARVYRTGGGDDLVTDTALLKVDVFAGDAGTADDVARLCQQRLISGPFAGTSFVTAAGIIDHAATLSSPLLATPPGGAQTQCSTASYRVTMRRPAAS